VTWRAVEDSKAGGNITAVVTNVAPIAVLPVGDLFEVSMPANTDTRIRAIVARQAYLSTETEYPGGSFTTSTAAIVNIPTTGIFAQDGAHVAGELNILRIQDLATNRLFRVTTWRLAGTAGNWSGWVEEIGVSFSGIIPAPQDFFRKSAGAALPDGASDYTAPVTHNGFLGLGMTTDPISPLDFGNIVRNDVIRLWDNGSSDPHQFYGFGVSGNTLRHQVDALAASHSFFGAASAASSRQYAKIADRKSTFGDPGAAIGEGHWTIATTSTNGAIEFRNPDLATDPNKIQSRILCEGYSGTSGFTGATIDFQTTSQGGTVPQSRVTVNSIGDVQISDPVSPFTPTTLSSALLTVNGAIRVKSGAIVPGGATRQTGGIVFGAGINAGGITVGAETDGGITSIADNNLTFYNNGVIAGRSDGGVWSKPGGGTWAATSDIRTKKNVKPFVSRLSNLLQLEVITFNYNGKGGTIDSPKSYTGLSAQAVQKLFPEWVLEVNGEQIDKTPVLQVDSSALVYELLEAVKAQQAAIATLKAEVLALKGGAPVPSATIGKVSALLSLDDAGLIAIGFSAASVPTFRTTSAPLKTAIASGLPEADILKLLAPLLAIAGLDVATVLARL
jgi:hypothetical protein